MSVHSAGHYGRIPADGLPQDEHGETAVRTAGGVVRTAREGQTGPIKRLIVACDGTWMDSDNGMLNGKRQIESNVTRIARAIKPESDDGVQQVVYYHKGIGVGGNVVDRVVTGATGEGLNENVREAYSFLSNNYAAGDEIYLIGFSRGAFTARTVAGIMAIVGLLTKRGLSYLGEIFKDVLHRHDPGYRSRFPDVPFRDKPSASDPRYAQELHRRGLSTLDVSIKAVGVWDTVGSLGIPRIGVLQNLGIQGRDAPEMAFYDTKLSNMIENAFQALALDEKRASFAPAVWEKPPGNRTKLRQVWFAGSHGNVGGGCDDQELANITLAWMMAQLSPWLDFNRAYLKQQVADNDAYYRSEGLRRRPWSFGLLFNSLTGVYALGGGEPRTPGEYRAVDPESGRDTRRPLRDTCEYVHASVRTRFVLRGPGKDDRGDYEPPALDDWKLVVEYSDGAQEAGARPRVFWRARFEDEDVSTRVLPESPLWSYERDLLALDPKIEEEVLYPPPTRRRVD